MTPPIEIIPYDNDWPDEFARISADLQQAITPWVSHIDHIGSTAVPGLAAKDRIDIQLRVPRFDPALKKALIELGYQFHDGLRDHTPPGIQGDDAEWGKWVFSNLPPRRPTNIHVRISGHAKARYALLFRDYLRTHPVACQAYAHIKRALAARHPDDNDFYYEIKDPLFDIIWEAAEQWASATGWQEEQVG